MDNFFVTITANAITDLDKRVNSARSGMGQPHLRGELVGGQFPFAGMVCQSLLMVPVEEETEHEDENIHS